MFRSIKIVALLIVWSVALTAKADTVVWPTNGHAYEFVSDEVLWPTAKAWAEQNTPPLGFNTGHLVTISDESENQFLVDAYMSKVPGWQSVWMGFTDEAVEGEWKWIDDTPGIWQDPKDFANPIQTAYTNWKSTEPNNQGENEDYGIIDPPIGEWNDGVGTSGRPFGFIVEYSPVPEPSTLVLLGVAAISLLGFVWRRLRS